MTGDIEFVVRFSFLSVCSLTDFVRVLAFIDDSAEIRQRDLKCCSPVLGVSSTALPQAPCATCMISPILPLSLIHAPSRHL